LTPARSRGWPKTIITPGSFRATNFNTDRRSIMSYAIVGFGKIGQALAHAFARKNIDVTVASRRPPEALAPQARAIGPTVFAKSLQNAVEADTIILAVPFGEHREVAKALPSWEGKTVIDATNAFPVPEELDGLPSSAYVAKAFTGAKLVKGFCGHPGCRSDRRGRPPGRLSVERRRGRERSRGGLGQTTRVRTRQAGKAQRGWRAGARTRPHLGSADLPDLFKKEQ
jgi:NADP oxidoreductase coenzyme F420-dependent